MTKARKSMGVSTGLELTDEAGLVLTPVVQSNSTEEVPWPQMAYITSAFGAHEARRVQVAVGHGRPLQASPSLRSTYSDQVVEGQASSGALIFDNPHIIIPAAPLSGEPCLAERWEWPDAKRPDPHGDVVEARMASHKVLEAPKANKAGKDYASQTRPDHIAWEKLLKP